MFEIVIGKYIKKLDKLRVDEKEMDNYRFKLSKDKKKDINQSNRAALGIILYNYLKIPDDYLMIKTLFEEEIKHRNSKTENYEYEDIYMYAFLLSEFKKIEDIWPYAALKFDGSMDSDMGFEIGFFLTYGKENLRKYLSTSQHPLKKKIEDKIFDNESIYSDETGEEYRQQQIAYFDFRKPISDPLYFYKWVNEKEYFKAEFLNWRAKTNLSAYQNAYNYVVYAKYLGEEEELIKAMENYIAVKPDDRLSTEYRAQLKK